MKNDLQIPTSFVFNCMRTTSGPPPVALCPIIWWPRWGMSNWIPVSSSLRQRISKKNAVLSSSLRGSSRRPVTLTRWLEEQFGLEFWDCHRILKLVGGWMMISKRNIFHFQVSIVRWDSTPQNHTNHRVIPFSRRYRWTQKKTDPELLSYLESLGCQPLLGLWGTHLKISVQVVKWNIYNHLQSKRTCANRKWLMPARYQFKKDFGFEFRISNHESR